MNYLAIIEMALGVILDLADDYIDAGVAQKIITLAKQLLPMLVGDFKDLQPVVISILQSVKQGVNVTQAQRDDIDSMIASADIDFDAAAADFNKRAHPNG